MNASIKLSAMYHRLITIALLGLAVAIRDAICIDRPEFFAPPVPGANANNNPASNFSTAPLINIPSGPPKLLESYLAPVMQALAYHIELLQYEPLSTTTIEPPFEGSATLSVSSTTVSPFGQWPSTQKPASAPWWQQSTSTSLSPIASGSSTPWWQQTTSTTPSPLAPTTSTPWWQQSTTSKPSSILPTTSTPWWQSPSTTASSSTQWWQKPTPTTTSTTPSSTTTVATTTTQKPSSIVWWSPSTTSTQAPTTTTPVPISSTTQAWWETSKKTTSAPPTISTPVPWWQTTTGKPPMQLSTQWWQTSSSSAPPWWETSSTQRPTTTQTVSPPWWQSSSQKPANIVTTTTEKPWWQSSSHKPADIVATTTEKPWWQSSSQKPANIVTTTTEKPWWQSSSQKPANIITTTTEKPWWQTSSTSRPATLPSWWPSSSTKPSSSTPWIQQFSTTSRPTTTLSWWQSTSKPATTTNWWQSTTLKPVITRPSPSISLWPTTQKPIYKPPLLPWFTTTKKPWWEITTKKPTSSSSWWSPFSTSITTTQKPWWQDSLQSKPPAISWSATTKPPTQWWTTTKSPASWLSTAKPTATWWTATKPSATWWSSGKPSTSWWTATKPTTQWWQRTTTKQPTNYWWQSTQRPWWENNKSTTQKPWWHSTSTTKPSILVSWDSPIWSLSNGKPASKPGLHSTDEYVVEETTPFHAPGNIPPTSLPEREDLDKPPFQENNIEYEAQADQMHPVSAVAPVAPASSTVNDAVSTTRKNQDWPFEMPSLAGDANFIDWLLQGKVKDTPNDIEYDFSLLDPLPRSLMHDLLTEKSELPALRDIDNVNEFLRVFDDSYGRSRQTSGKKRIPPTKPYVEFLMLYDLLKREAKALNLTMYEGYSDKMVQDLAATSKRSSEIQLHILMTRMLEQGEITRSDVTTRIKAILKDLENPNTVTAKSLHLIPPLQFVP